MDNLKDFKSISENDFTEISGGWGYGEALTVAGTICSVGGLATGGVGWAVGGVIVAGAGIGHMIYSNSRYNSSRR